MSIFVIGDENTVIGFALVGIEGAVATTEEEARTALNRVLEREGVEIVLVSEAWAAKMRDTVDRLKMTQMHPLVLEIPAEGTEPPEESLRALIQRAVGVRIGG